MGILAEDYDILNQFGQTDHVIDLFKEIEEAYKGNPRNFRIYDHWAEVDPITNFVPIVYHED